MKTKVNLQGLHQHAVDRIPWRGAMDSRRQKRAQDANLYDFLKWSEKAFEHASYHHQLAIYIDVANQWLKKKKTLEDFRLHVINNHLEQSAT